MKDFKNDLSAPLSRFGRDKRTRSNSTESMERSPRLQRDAADSEQSRPRRKSFNPNFSSDNRPLQSSSRGERKSFGDKPYGERKSFGDKPYGERKSYGDKPRGERKSFGDKPYGERKSFGDKPYGERKSYGDKPRGERKSYGDKPRGERKSYGDKPYGERKSFGDKPYGERKSFGDKPYGERKSFGDKPYGERKSFGDKPRGRFNKERDNSSTASYPKYDPNRQSGEMRLNRFLAQAGLCSRREADDYIAAGVVTVNGEVVSELGAKVMPTDEIKFNDSLVKGEKKVYLLLNKPKGYVTSLDDPHADKTVMELVKSACSERIYPVGRLDKNSLGVLLFTNDGDITKQLTHPSHRKKKIYQVTLDKPLTKADMDSIAQGITLEDGEIYADAISYVQDSKNEVGIEIHSGRNRIVRRIFEHLGYTVQKLDRVYFAGLTKKNLRRGQWRFLSHDEVERLKSGRYE